ncbi:aminotransferase class IV [Nocardiopsis potens]|uniref:aminotransferase class IV n=1 Tax=Nocardiopsis potens TaxID=1246458 RepID=UPI00034CFE89
MIHLDGRPASPEELIGPALYGYGHFTTMRVQDMRVRGLSLHLDRLAADCRFLFGTELDTGAVRERVREAAEREGSPLVVRVTVTDPDLELGHPARDARPRLLVTTRPAGPDRAGPVSLATVPFERDLPRVKGTALLGTLVRRRAAQASGFDDALFLDRRSLVSEGATFNVAFLCRGTLLWPSAEHLPGTTMRLLSELAGSVGLASRPASVHVADLPGMEAALVTNAATGVRPVAAVDEHPFPVPAPVVERLAAAYRALPGEPL